MKKLCGSCYLNLRRRKFDGLRRRYGPLCRCLHAGDPLVRPPTASSPGTAAADLVWTGRPGVV